MGLFDGKRGEVSSPAPVAELEKPRHVAAPKKLVPSVDRNTMPEDSIAEYRRVASEIGVSDADMLVEEFRLFLASKDIPTFNLQAVVSYMDELVERDNPTGLGWHWVPVREKDANNGMAITFGRPSTIDRSRWASPYDSGEKKIPASDFYESHRIQSWHGHRQSMGMMQFASMADAQAYQPPQPPDWRTMHSAHYSRTLPLHALKKIAMIEREFKGGQPIFLVTDYVTQPHVVVNPDPFLMAVIPNSAVAHGKGRFIIDVWDEPGFGIDHMLK